MANQWRMKIEGAAGELFEDLRCHVKSGGADSSRAKIVLVDGQPFMVKVTIPEERHVESPKPPLAKAHPQAMGLHQKPISEGE